MIQIILNFISDLLKQSDILVGLSVMAMVFVEAY